MLVPFRVYGPNHGSPYAGRYVYGLLPLSTLVTVILRNLHPRRGPPWTPGDCKHGLL